LGIVRGHNQMYIQHVMQSHEGCDFDFLVGKSGSDVHRESH
jgi:dihydroxy-acid dehydratase